MRVSRTVWVIVGFIVIGIVLGLMASNYFETVAEHRALEGRLTTAQTRIPALTAEKTDLENQERQATSALETSQAKFPRTVESIEYGDDLFALATASNVRLTRLTMGSPGTREVGGITYSVSTFVLVVDGQIKDILGFVHALRNPRDFQLPWSSQIREVNIAYGSGQTLIGLDIYGYKR